MSVEFDSHCGTAQAEDCLQLYIPAASHRGHAASAGSGDGLGTGVDAEHVTGWWPVLSKFHGVEGWPTSAVILPGSNS